MGKLTVVMFLLKEVEAEIQLDSNKAKICDYLKMVRRLTLEIEKEIEAEAERKGETNNDKTEDGSIQK